MFSSTGYLSATTTFNIFVTKDRALIAPGDTNVWICHVGDASNYSSFEEFTEKILTSNVTVENAAAQDDLINCLEENHCLSGNILDTLECLSATGSCQLSHHQDSLLGSCLMKDHSPATHHHHHHSITALGRRLDCF